MEVSQASRVTSRAEGRGCGPMNRDAVRGDECPENEDISP
jgi:hypothetical protein